MTGSSPGNALKTTGPSTAFPDTRDFDLFP